MMKWLREFLFGPSFTEIAQAQSEAFRRSISIMMGETPEMAVTRKHKYFIDKYVETGREEYLHLALRELDYGE